MKTLLIFIITSIAMVALILLLDLLQHLGPTHLIHILISAKHRMENEDYILALLYITSFFFLTFMKRKRKKD